MFYEKELEEPFPIAPRVPIVILTHVHMILCDEHVFQLFKLSLERQRFFLKEKGK